MVRLRLVLAGGRARGTLLARTLGSLSSDRSCHRAVATEGVERIATEERRAQACRRHQVMKGEQSDERKR